MSDDARGQVVDRERRLPERRSREVHLDRQDLLKRARSGCGRDRGVVRVLQVGPLHCFEEPR